MPSTSPVNPELQFDDRTHQIAPVLSIAAPRCSISSLDLAAQSRLRSRLRSISPPRDLAFDPEPRSHPTPDAPVRSCRRVCAAEIIGAVVLVLILNPKLIGAIVTDLVLVAHRHCRYRSRSHSRRKAHRRRRSRRLDLIAPMISLSRSRCRFSFPEVFDLSLFLPLFV